MSSLITSDIHLSDNPIEEYRHHFMGQTLPFLVDNAGADKLYILGDLTDRKTGHSEELVNRTADHVKKLSKLCEVVFIAGNHDFIDINNPFFAFLRHITNVSWHSVPHQEGSLLLLPYSPWLDDALRNLDSSVKMVFTHATFAGAVAETGRILRGIPIESIPRGVQIVSGDVHVPQTIGPVIHVGAPYTIHFGDDYKPRVLVMDGNGRRSSIPVPGVQKRLLEVDGNANPPRILPGNPGDILKIRVRVDSSQAARWSSLQGKIKRWAESKGYVAHLVQPSINQIPTIVRTATARRTDHQLVHDYAGKVGIDKPTLAIGEAFLS